MCGMEVDPDHPVATLVEPHGSVVYFCCESCRQQYLGAQELVARDAPAPPDPAKPRPAAIDPICGMEVDPDHPGATLVEPHGSVVYFCCESCALKFSRVAETERNPAISSPAGDPR
jgi:YHS domain-containing protein